MSLLNEWQLRVDSIKAELKVAKLKKRRKKVNAVYYTNKKWGDPYVYLKARKVITNLDEILALGYKANDHYFFNIQAVAKIIGYGKTQWYYHIKNGLFPRPQFRLTMTFQFERAYDGHRPTWAGVYHLEEVLLMSAFFAKYAGVWNHVKKEDLSILKDAIIKIYERRLKDGFDNFNLDWVKVNNVVDDSVNNDDSIKEGDE